jgi:uncharacterized protein (TIGR03089 family)
MTPYAALLDRMKADPASPVLTYRDLATGERMEFSAVSLGNAIAKTAGLLRDELDAEPGTTVAVHLPCHWQRVVWLGACAATGAVFAPDLDPRDGNICVLDRAHLGLSGIADDDVLVSLAPFGLPEPQGAPPGVIDAAVAMRAHPDAFIPVDLPTESMPLIRSEPRTVTQGELLDQAWLILDERGVATGERFAIADPDPDTDVLTLAGALMARSAAVLIAGAGAKDLSSVLREEGIGHRAG